MTTAINTAAVCTVKPAHYGTPEWEEALAPLIHVAEGRHLAAPREWAETNMLKHEDTADLRALFICRTCGRDIELVQAGRCVYSSPCDHYRAQGDVRRSAPYLAKRRQVLNTTETARRDALLALVGRT